MKRLEEKVKDIVDVRAFAPLTDLAADPVETLASYRFTDITSVLMAKWIERAAGLNRGIGTAAALAGFRGVGKTHFLSTVSAILTRPDLRAQISDVHVRSAADALTRRAYHVATVRRGSEASLADELKTAVAAATGLERASLGNSATEILHQCSVRYADAPFVIFFDTMAGREARVSRDDGPILSEVAEIGKSMGMFVGVALDDDISGADGANSSISASFAIDYLDQEHLFKIVDTHIFAKNGTKLPLLREIYTGWRRELKAFRWSEQRFLSLYPMHPATLEVAPLIRLYQQDFALLGFASEAGVKILGRPANSLIGLDEMFDNVELRLRQVDELGEAFAIYDRVESEVIAKAPVSSRLAARLVLKGLFLLSLDGQGTSADEIAAGMMILGGHANVGEILRSFTVAGALENDSRYTLHGRSARSETPNSLEISASEVEDNTVWDLLLRLASEKFSDIDTSDEFGRSPTLCTVEWRGALRRGEIVWRGSQRSSATSDWTVVVERRDSPRVDLHGEHPTLLWRIAQLTEQERATLRRYHVLRTDATVRQELGEGLATALQIHSIASERVWQRVFLSEAKLVGAGIELPIFEEGVGAHTLAQLLSHALAPYFDALYPGHPDFGGTLGVRETNTLISNFFGGAAPESAETRRLVEDFAVPLGLAPTSDLAGSTAMGDGLLSLPVVASALAGDAGAEIALTTISERLNAAPLGLTREAQHLILAALVAQREFDFVTASGNRINHRSLDLQIIWDDIQAIAPPQAEEYAVDRLLSWAKVLTGNRGLSSIDRREDRTQIIDSLRQWLSDWKADDTLAKFDELPEEHLNTAVWRLASGLKRSFGSAALSLDALLREEITLVECLRSVAVLFSDSESDYEAKTDDLAVLNKFVLVSSGRPSMLTYVAVSDWTGDESIDHKRRELLNLLSGGGVSLNGKNDRVQELWIAFRDGYAAKYAECHRVASDLALDGSCLNELRSSELWNAFLGVCELPLMGEGPRSEFDDVIRQLKSSGCKSDPSPDLTQRPLCCCGLSLKELEDTTLAPSRLTSLMEKGLREFAARISGESNEIIRRGRDVYPGSNIEFIVERFGGDRPFPRLTASEIRLLEKACDGTGAVVCNELPSEIDNAEIDMALLSVGE